MGDMNVPGAGADLAARLRAQEKRRAASDEASAGAMSGAQKAAAGAAAGAALKIVTLSETPPPPAVEGEEGGVALAAPSTAPPGSMNTLEQINRQLADMAKVAFYDLYALAELLAREGAQMSKTERLERQTALDSQVADLHQKAKDIKKEATDRLIAGVVNGAMEVGAAGIKTAGGIRGAKALSGSSFSDGQQAAAASQAMQMKYGASADMTASSGHMASSGASFAAEEERAKQSGDDASAAHDAATMQDAEGFQKEFWNLQEQANQIFREYVQSNHEAQEKSLY